MLTRTAASLSQESDEANNKVPKGLSIYADNKNT